MSRDRHADRLYARLAGGAELTSDERRHVATCPDCKRAVADASRLDEHLRAATASLASEPIPEADLEPLDAPAAGWAAPLSVAIAAGVIAVAVGFGLSQLRPPTGADATPTAAPSSPAAQSAAPSPSATAMPPPPVTPLASGGDACADGEAGFAIVVPDGWYANLRQGGLMACSFIAAEPFEPHVLDADPNVEIPIRLTTWIDATPAGIVIEHTGETEAAAERWVVERADENWVVYVVALPSSIGDQPSYLHLSARTADVVATDALALILDRLTVHDSMQADPGAVAVADELFADADVCSDLERGVNVILPDAWWTNTVLGDLAACSYFAPASFDVGAQGTIPDGVAITLEVVAGNIGTIEETLGFETLVVDQHAATRWELTPGLGDPPPNTRTYQYAVELDDTPDDGPNLVLTVQRERSDDYERDKAVLDEMMRRLIISPTPAFVRDLEPLPTCGWELVELTVEGHRYDTEARACLWEAYEAGEAAELISTSHSVEGTIIRVIYRILGRDEIEFIVDWSHDLGQRPWDLMRCTGLERRADDELSGAILFDPAPCDSPIQLDP